MAERVELSLESVTFSCPKHGTFEMTRAFQGKKLLTHVGDVFPCRCWYELEDSWYDQREELSSSSWKGEQRELFQNSRVPPQGDAG